MNQTKKSSSLTKSPIILQSSNLPQQQSKKQTSISPQLLKALQNNKYLQNIQTLIQQQIQLQLTIPNNPLIQNNILTQVLGNQLKQYLSQIKIQRLKIHRVRQEEVYGQFVQNCIHKILELNQKITKIKEFYLYCKHLKNKSTELEDSIEKYFEYAKKQTVLVQQLQAYLNNPIVSDIIFRQYLKTYNVNIFTSDLIVHYSQLNLKGLLKQPQNRVFLAQRIPQLCLLQKNNVVFKQLYQINQKYTDLADQMKYSYINNVIELVLKYEQIEQPCTQKQQQKNNKKQDTFQQYNSTINQKLQNLNYLIGKMSLIGNNIMHNLQNTQLPVLVNEYEQNFTTLTRHIKFCDQGIVNKGQLHFGYKKFISSIFQADSKLNQKQTLTAFFEKNLMFQSQTNRLEEQNEENLQKFQFLQQKIIKTESLVVLNKVFSTFNMFSYILQQINPLSCKQAEYTFKSLKTHIDTEFRGQFIRKQSQQQTNDKLNPQNKKTPKTNYHSPSHKAHFNVFIETDEFGNWVLMSGNQKLIYPSAINSLVEILHYMTQIATLLQKKGLYSSELMLQILSLKAQQVSKIGQVIFNIYNLIKSKQVNCYNLLNDYLKVILKGFFQCQIRWIQNLDMTQDEHQLFLNELDQIQKAKMNNVKQDADFDIEKQYLDERKRVAAEITHARVTRFLTYYAEKAKKADFLSQIIYELDSNYEIYPVLQQLLYCQQYHNKTFYFHDNSQFYEIVLYEIIQMRNHIKLDHYFTLPRLNQAFGFFTIKALSFGDILNQLAHFSTKQIKIEQLLLFFKTQLTLKRAVFRGQLYWLSYKNTVQNGKDKVFKQFVEQQAKDILSLAQEPLEYFLINIKEFVKKVSLFEQQIQKFKHCQTLVGKMQQSRCKVKNIESYLNVLTCSELHSISKSLCQYNPIAKILKNSDCSQQLFSDIKMSIQLNNRIRFEDISRNVALLQEKQSLSEQLFTMKCFAFELGYNDCFNILVDGSKKSYISPSQGLKLLINRQKYSMIKHYEQMLAEDVKTIHSAISFYKCLILVSLLSIRSEIVDEQDQQCIQELLKHLSLPLNIMEQIQRVKQVFMISKQSEPQSHQMYRLLRIKAALKRLQLLTNQTHTKYMFASLQYENHSIQTICLVAKLSLYTQKKMVQKMQQVHHQIIEKQTTDSKKILKELNCLNNKIVGYFLALMTKCQHEYFNSIDHHKQQSIRDKDQQQNRLITFSTINQALQQVQQQFLHKIIQLTSLNSTTYSNKQDLYLFDTHCGYKVKHEFQQTSTSNPRGKQLMRRNDRKVIKKGIFSPVRSTHSAQNNIMQNIQKRVGIQMIKESMGLRKVISKLQLQEKKMKDEIAWETSKLQHNVIKKIHAFITESNMDQQQSYINFKYTVNLQTIKGMQNVIKQQTQLAIKASHQTMNKQYKQQDKHHNKHHQVTQKKEQQKADFFLTNPNQADKDIDDQESRLGYQNSRMLNTNIDSIFNHMKKIKVFAAWKKINRNMDLTNQQWKNFNKNVAQILHNEQNVQKIQLINKKRNQCFKENILCSLLKEENQILSQRIRNSKIQSLNKIVQDYKRKLIGESDQQS